jgi:hypothetical protein
MAGMLSVGLLLSCGDDDPVGPDRRAKIVAINGLYYKGEMGSDTVDKPLQFAVADKNDNYLPYQQIQLEQLEGDGKLDPKSIVTDSTGIAGFTFNFNGTLGHTRIRLIAPDIDSLDILIRANTLIPGVSGQGQYVLFDDTYTDVKHFNGLPASVDIFDSSEVIYVNYEADLGVVVMVYDLDTNGVIYDTSSVYGVIVNSVYSETTVEGIGIGSPLDSLKSAYGEPDSIWWDPRPPAAVAVKYYTLGMTFYCWPSDTSVFEIHLTEYVTTPKFSNKEGAIPTNLPYLRTLYRKSLYKNLKSHH